MRDCGSSSFTPISYSSFFHCGCAGLREQQFYPHFIFILFPLRECRTAGATVLPPFHIHPFSTAGVQDCGSNSFTPISYSSFFHCGSAGLREQQFYPHFIFLLFPLRECGTAGAVVLSPFHIHPFSTAGVRDCGSSSFIPISYSCFFHCGSVGLREQQLYPHFIFIRTLTLTLGLQDCGSMHLMSRICGWVF